MTRLVTRFKPWHMDWLRERGEAIGGAWINDAEMLKELERQNSWTAVVDGSPVMCGGTFMHWPGRHMAWTYMGDVAGPHMVWLTRETRKVLDEVRGRLEITVRRDFEKGHRWARLLGFEVETPVLRAFGPEGEDHTGYVRFNG